jgi:hypothetical protein
MTRQGVLLVVGKKGSGKTNLVREFLNAQPEPAPPVAPSLEAVVAAGAGPHKWEGAP